MAIVQPGQTAQPFLLRGIDDQTYTLNQHGARLTLAVFFKPRVPPA